MHATLALPDPSVVNRYQRTQVDLVSNTTHVSDRVAAAVTAWAVVLCEARHAVYAALMLVKLGPVDRLSASIACEVLRVPFLVQRCHYLE